MKKSLILIAGFYLVFSSCVEVGPDINFDPIIESANDTTYITDNVPAPQPRVVMLEEYTGIKCVNCVAGHDKIHDLKDTYGDRLVAASIHATFFANPISGKSVIDFRTDEAEDIAQEFGVSGLPAGVVDRKIFPAETGYPVGIAKWDSYISDQLAETSKLNLELKALEYDASDSTHTVQLEIVLLEDLSGPLNITIMVTENGIEEYQLGPQGDLPNYIHNEVMRATVTPAVGTKLDLPDFNRGRVAIRNFDVKIRPNWNPDNLHVVAFIHEVGGSKTILQADEISL